MKGDTEERYVEDKIYNYTTFNYLHLLALLCMVGVMIHLRLKNISINKYCGSDKVPIFRYTISVKNTKKVNDKYLQNWNAK